MGKQRPVCLHVLGDPPPEIAAKHGTFRSWFERLWRDDPIDIEVMHASEYPKLPRAQDYAGIVMTGSLASLTAPEPWMEGAVLAVRDAARVGTPLLGVCFGHQVIGAAFGAGVLDNPAGWEVSTGTIELTELGQQDPLFEGLGPQLRVNLSHADMVDPSMMSPLVGTRVLARNDHTEVQALAAGEFIRGVQFHPEFSGAVTATVVRHHADKLAKAGLDPAALAAAAADCPDGERVYHNFTRNFILRS